MTTPPAPTSDDGLVPVKPPRTLSISDALHTRLWLLKIRRNARTLEDVVEQALDALEEQEANDG